VVTLRTGQDPASATLTLEGILEAYSREQMLQRLAAQSPLVPPEGPIASPVMLVGEAPGADEVRLMRPFAGRAGAVLDRTLMKASLERKWSWITNVVLYRPPANRTPYPFEIQVSRSRLMAEIALVRPLWIVSMGATAFRALLPSSGQRYEDARGHWHQPGDDAPPVLVTWHPAATFHSDQADREFLQHVCLRPS
jgi:uracil-DNA glycosylase